LVLVLVISSGVAIDIFEKIAKEIRINKLFLATILVGFSMSLPELAVGIASSFRGEPQIALGNIIGANLANLSWIVGGAAIMAGTISVVGDFWKKDLWTTIFLASLPFLMMVDQNLTRVDGLILIVVYFIYINRMLRSRTHLLVQAKLVGRKPAKHSLNKTNWSGYVVGLLVAMMFLAFSAWGIIDLAVSMSRSLGVSVFWVGLLVISSATTLPELILSIFIHQKQKISLVLADILGSVVVNSTLILGLVAMISPINYGETVQKGVAGVFLVVILSLFWLFTSSKHKLERWEGMVLVGFYAMFLGLQFLLV
jgi:cation:H+ antiporter